MYNDPVTKNPLLNALSAAAYIVGIVSLISLGESMDQPETILIPIVMLSLFVLSAAIMGFIFFYHPVLLFLEGKKGDAVALFLKSLGFFACITILLLLTIFFTR